MKKPEILKLKVRWSKKDNDFIICYTNKADGHFFENAFSGTVIKRKLFLCELTRNQKLIDPNFFEQDSMKELDDRGYDLTTFKMEISIKKERFSENFSYLVREMDEKQRIGPNYMIVGKK